MIRRIFKSAVCIMAALMVYQPSNACSNVIVSKGASKDGSVMVTYAADSNLLYGELYFTPAGVFPAGTYLDVTEWDTGKFLGKIPQIGKTYQTVGNMNEHQVIITETTFGGREELADPNGILDYGSLIYITLQRAKSAREAIKIIDELMQTYGYASGGESFSIADTEEAWIMEIVGKGTKEKGAVWVAARVPDGYICAHANQSRIHKINFNDPENWLYTEDVVDFAREMGYYKGSDEDFSFCDAYCPADFSGMRACEARVWSAYNILGKGMFNDTKAEEYLDFAMGYNSANKMPLFIKPAEKVSVKQLADVMRDHYEGTPMDMTQDIGAGGHHSPIRWRPTYFEVDGKKYLNERPLAVQQTGFWMLGQARGWLPDEVGGVIWFGVDDAATSCLTPIYTCITEVPECFRVGNGDLLTYSPTSMFWLTNRVAHMAYLMYDKIAPDIQAAASSFENKCVEELKTVDAQALEVIKNGGDVRNYLTSYSLARAQTLFDIYKELDTYFLVKYLDGYIKVQNPDGSFKDNGYTPLIPAAPKQPSYSQKWKEAVVKDAGEKLMVK